MGRTRGLSTPNNLIEEVKMGKDGERYLSVFECEKLTGREASTWRRDILERKISYVKLGRQVKIPQSEIDRLIKEGWRPAIKGTNPNEGG